MHAIFDPKCQVKNQEKSTKKPVFEMHKRSINLEENYFFAYLMEIDLGNQNKTKKHACLRNTPREKAVEFDLKCALVYVILIVWSNQTNKYVWYHLSLGLQANIIKDFL